MYDTLIIDLDGPIFPGRTAMMRAMSATIEHFAAAHGTPARVLTSIPLLAPETHVHLMYAEADLDTSALAGIVAHYRSVLRKEEDALDIAQEVRDWLSEMKRYCWLLAVLTNRPEKEASDLLNAKGLGPVFSAIVGRDSGVKPKPSGEGVRAILAKLGKSAGQAVMIGDTDSDFEAAREEGVAYLHAGWSAEPATVHLQDQKLLVSRPQEVRDILLDAAWITLAPIGLPKPLAEAVAGGDLAFFAGAGVSVPSGLGGWKQHYEPLLAKAGVSWMAEARDLPDVLQLACIKEEGSIKVFEAFKDSFCGDHRPNAYHFATLRARARRIWTSNYDQLFERAIRIGGLDQRVVKDDKQLLNNYSVPRLVLKVNGDFEGATFNHNLKWDVVLTRQQFDRALTERPELWRLFEDDFRNRSLVFVGVSFQDPILRQVVAIATDRIPKTQYIHYLLAAVPVNPVERTLQAREARNLERFHVQTLWFADRREIRRFVSRVGIVSRRPIIGVAGNTQTADADGTAERIPDALSEGALDGGALRELNAKLGRTLAWQGYRVTSGGAPYVGAEAVEAAFSVRPSCARFYFRRGGGRSYRRLAPAIVVEDSSYAEMRRRFIGELSVLIAMGGYRLDCDPGGVEDEITLATELGVPVLLIPQAGGDVAALWSAFMERIDSRYPDVGLAGAIRKANVECAKVVVAELQVFIQCRLPELVEDVLEALIESGIQSHAASNTFQGATSW
jgi:phosphoglycolate phosphatase